MNNQCQVQRKEAFQLLTRRIFPSPMSQKRDPQKCLKFAQPLGSWPAMHSHVPALVTLTKRLVQLVPNLAGPAKGDSALSFSLPYNHEKKCQNWYNKKQIFYGFMSIETNMLFTEKWKNSQSKSSFGAHHAHLTPHHCLLCLFHHQNESIVSGVHFMDKDEAATAR